MNGAVITAFANLFVQIIFTAGTVGLFGMFISFCNRCFYDSIGKSAFFIVRISGIIGTPIHELSHAFMCILFGHRITDIKIYNFKMRSRTLGYVEHTYCRKNLYHQIGNFFIGVSPIVFGGLFVTLLVSILTPGLYNALISEGLDVMNVSLKSFVVEIPKSIGTALAAVFSPKNLVNWRWWICMIFSVAISIHMEISSSDIKGGLKGLAAISVVLLVLNLILAFLFPGALKTVTTALVTAGLYVSTFLMIPAVFSGIILLISLLSSLFKALGKSIENSRA